MRNYKNNTNEHQNSKTKVQKDACFTMKKLQFEIENANNYPFYNRGICTYIFCFCFHCNSKISWAGMRNFINRIHLLTNVHTYICTCIYMYVYIYKEYWAVITNHPDGEIYERVLKKTYASCRTSFDSTHTFWLLAFPTSDKMMISSLIISVPTF